MVANTQRVFLQSELQLHADHGLQDLRQWLAAGRGAGWHSIRAAGGRIHGLWHGQADDSLPESFLLHTTWPDAALAGAAVQLLSSSSIVAGLVSLPLSAVRQRIDTKPVAAEGMWMFHDLVFDKATEEDVPSPSVAPKSSATGQGAIADIGGGARAQKLFRAPPAVGDGGRFLVLARCSGHAAENTAVTGEQARQQTAAGLTQYVQAKTYRCWGQLRSHGLRRVQLLPLP